MLLVQDNVVSMSPCRHHLTLTWQCVSAEPVVHIPQLLKSAVLKAVISSLASCHVTQILRQSIETVQFKREQQTDVSLYNITHC